LVLVGSATHGHDPVRPTSQIPDEQSEASVGRHYQVEVPAAEDVANRLREMGVRVNVLEVGDFLDLVRASVENGDVVAPHRQPVRDVWSGRACAADKERLHESPFQAGRFR
jgi:hypothetical protein